MAIKVRECTSWLDSLLQGEAYFFVQTVKYIVSSFCQTKFSNIIKGTRHNQDIILLFIKYHLDYPRLKQININKYACDNTLSRSEKTIKHGVSFINVRQVSLEMLKKRNSQQVKLAYFGSHLNDQDQDTDTDETPKTDNHSRGPLVGENSP